MNYRMYTRDICQQVYLYSKKNIIIFVLIYKYYNIR